MTKILGYGELMLRFTPKDNLSENNNSEDFKTNFGGSESNSLCFLASKGFDCTFLSAFPNNELGLRSKQFLHDYNVKTNISLDNNRLGVYYTIPGKNNNLTKIAYDRDNSSFSKYKLPENVINDSLKDISHLIISGITPALSKTCYDNIFKIIDISKSKGIKIIYDINYRENLWSLEDCKNFNLNIFNYIDFLFTNANTVSRVLGISFKKESGKLFYQTENAINYINENFNIPFVSMTVRDNDFLGGVLFTDNDFYRGEIYNIDHVDRVGAGDAFLAATMNGVFNNWDYHKIISYSTSAFALSHTIFGDVNLFDDEEIEQFKNNSIESAQGE